MRCFANGSLEESRSSREIPYFPGPAAGAFMSDMIENSKKPVPETDVPATTDAGRRRLLQGGLGVAPVVLTLASRSTFGDTSTGQCTTPSGFVSGNTSKPGGSTGCGGQ